MRTVSENIDKFIEPNMVLISKNQNIGQWENIYNIVQKKVYNKKEVDDNINNLLSNDFFLSLYNPNFISIPLNLKNSYNELYNDIQSSKNYLIASKTNSLDIYNIELKKNTINTNFNNYIIHFDSIYLINSNNIIIYDILNSSSIILNSYNNVIISDTVYITKINPNNTEIFLYTTNNNYKLLEIPELNIKFIFNLNNQLIILKNDCFYINNQRNNFNFGNLLKTKIKNNIIYTLTDDNKIKIIYFINNYPYIHELIGDNFYFFNDILIITNSSILYYYYISDPFRPVKIYEQDFNFNIKNITYFNDNIIILTDKLNFYNVYPFLI
jgi:hypothetical protein